jgi:hypothetical protein
LARSAGADRARSEPVKDVRRGHDTTSARGLSVAGPAVKTDGRRFHIGPYVKRDALQEATVRRKADRLARVPRASTKAPRRPINPRGLSDEGPEGSAEGPE